MSKIVTDRQFNLLVNHLDAPFKEKATVSEALDFIREEKGIACCAFYMVETIANGLNKTLWYIKYGIADQETIYNSYNVDYKYYYTHPLAESALLDAVLDYLSIK